MATQSAASPATGCTQPDSSTAHSASSLPASTKTGQVSQPQVDNYIPGQSASKSSFNTRYSQATSYLPASVSSRLPSAEAAEHHVGTVASKLGVIGGAAAERATVMAREGSERMKGIDLDGFKGKLTPEMMTKCAWSVRNETQVALNVSRVECGGGGGDGWGAEWRGRLAATD